MAIGIYIWFLQARWVVRRMHWLAWTWDIALTLDFTCICSWWRHELRQLWYMRVLPWVVCVFSLGYSSAPEWIKPVLWPRTWLCKSMWEQQQQQHLSRSADSAVTAMGRKRLSELTIPPAQAIHPAICMPTLIRQLLVVLIRGGRNPNYNYHIDCRDILWPHHRNKHRDGWVRSAQ